MDHPHIQAVIFDMDGLLVDSEPIQFETSQLLFKRYGHKFLLKDLKNFLGVRLVEELAILKKRWRLTSTIDQLAAERRTILFRLTREKMQLHNGAKELLMFLKRSSVPVGLGTSSERWYIDEIMHKFDLRSYFDVIITSEQVKRGKPHPEVYLTVATKLGVSPAGCLVLEDAVTGVAAARAARMICFTIPSPYIPKPKFCHAHRILPSLREVLLLLKRRKHPSAPLFVISDRNL